jgi:hypothetical protein
MRKLHIQRCKKYLMPASIPTEFPASTQGVTTKQKIEKNRLLFLKDRLREWDASHHEFSIAREVV